MRKLIFICFLLSTLQAGAQSMAPELWRKDISLLQSEIPRRYPDFFAHYPQVAWEANLRGIAERVEGKSNLQIGLELQSVLARAGDAYLHVDLTQPLQTSKVIPVGLGWFGGGLYVSGTIRKFENTLGRKVLAVNGIPAAEAVEKVRMFLSIENEFGLKKDGPQWLRFPMVNRMSGLSKSDTLVLTLETPDAEPENVPVYPVDFRTGSRVANMPAQMVPTNPDLRFQPLSAIYRQDWLPADSIYYFQINYCASREMAAAAGDSVSAAQLPPFQPMADSIVAFLKGTPGARLFIDLRYNPGGNPADGIALARRLGSIPEINRPGRIWIGINSYTTAAPAIVAENFRLYTEATIIGEPTIEKPVHDGNKDFLKLPNSGLQIFYPTALRPLAKGSRDALYPDITVEMTFDAFKNGRDPVLDYVRKKK